LQPGTRPRAEHRPASGVAIGHSHGIVWFYPHLGRDIVAYQGGTDSISDY
jgi:hypothetical protein